MQTTEIRNNMDLLPAGLVVGAMLLLTALNSAAVMLAVSGAGLTAMALWQIRRGPDAMWLRALVVMLAAGFAAGTVALIRR